MSRLPHDLYTAAQVRELDRLTIEEFGVPGYTLMTRAGQAAFDAARAKWPYARRIAVVCGVGNNGGDGYVIARLAHEAGLEVTALRVGAKERLRGDALKAAEDMEAAGLAAQPFQATALAGAELIVDALFGTGLDREVAGEWRAVIEAINASEAPVLAVDIPSGLHADTGRPLGAVVKAALTVTFIGLKRGLFTGEGPGYCGEILFDDLDAPPAVYERVETDARRIADLSLPWLAPRHRTAHKGDNGRVLIVGGDYGMGGAVRMAGDAAARAGAGLITVATRERHIAAISAGRPELLCYALEEAGELRELVSRADVIAVGPGLGRSPWGRDMLSTVLNSDTPLVMDADALNLLAEAPARRDNWILTPHPGEASRLLGTSTEEIQGDRFAAVNRLQARFGGVVVLKGAGTLVAGAEGPVGLCEAGNPGMASGGMGDILTGLLAGLLAQGLKQGVSLTQVAQAGVCIHAQAADIEARYGERGMLASDLLPHIRRLVNP